MLIFEKVSFNYGAGQPKKRRGKKTGAAPPEQQGRERRQGQEHEREHGREPGRKQGQWQGPEPRRERGQEHEQGHEQEREFGRRQGQEPEPKRERSQEHEQGHEQEQERLLGATISDVTFRLNEGEFAALMGENGAGKSTLCRLCNGLLLPDSGSVTACGRDTRTARTSDIAAGVGFLFQNPDRQLCQNTVRDEIMFGLDLTMPGSAEPERRRRCDETLELFSLDGARDPFGLSRGERQLVALASVLARKPRLLVLDEPTTGLDYRECMNIMAAVKRLQQAGTAILMITHDMEVALDFAERALILSRGRLICDGRMKDVMKDAGLLGAASLLPAQIPVLALALGAEFEGVCTVGEMAGRAERLSRLSRERQSNEQQSNER